MTRAEYMRIYRAADPARRRADIRRGAERRRALELLRKEYPARYAELLEQVRADQPPARRGRPRSRPGPDQPGFVLALAVPDAGR